MNEFHKCHITDDLCCQNQVRRVFDVDKSTEEGNNSNPLKTLTSRAAIKFTFWLTLSNVI